MWAAFQVSYIASASFGIQVLQQAIVTLTTPSTEADTRVGECPIGAF